MTFNVLKNDLKRKKSINLILFLFIILASMLMTGSANVLYSTSTAISRMIKNANVPDMSVFAYDASQTNEQIMAWAESSDKVDSLNRENFLMIMSDSFYLDGEIIVSDDNVSTVMLTAVPQTNSLVFNQDDQLLTLEKQEIAIPMRFHKMYDVFIGDKISILVEDEFTEFTVAAYQKDIVFGSDTMGMSRFIISADDLALYSQKDTRVLQKIIFWAVETPGGVTYREVAGEFGSKEINALFFLGQEDIDSTYFVSKLVAIIMIVVSLCLILISFLILRFTIVFTIQEDYREIGVMKAIGIKNAVIRRLYLVKYFAISLLGGAIGFFVSFLYSGVMLDSISDLFIMQTDRFGMILAVLSSALVVVLSIFFCFICTRKINKVSVIDAIRQGNTGERFSRSRKISLSKMHMTKPADFLSLSDLLNGFRKFAVLTITFIIGTLLVIVPLNVINTLKDSETILGLFGLPPYDVNVWTDETYNCSVSGDLEALENELIRIETLFEKEGYPIDLHAEIAKSVNMYTNNSNDSFNVSAWQSQNYTANDFRYLEGSAPMLENEIAVSTKMAEYFDISIGDSVTCLMQDETYTFIVTALYQSMMGMGANIRLSDHFPMTSEWFSSFTIMGQFSDKAIDMDKAVSEMKMAYPDLTISMEIDLYNNNLGGSVKTIDSIKNLIVAVVLGIIFLITSLIVRMLISREISEIALLKSIGFRSQLLRRWQIGRIAIILILSIILGTLLAGSLGGVLLNAAFSIMGVTQVELVIIPLQVYLIYPAVLLASTILAAAISIGQIKKTKVWEINNQE